MSSVRLKHKCVKCHYLRHTIYSNRIRTHHHLVRKGTPNHLGCCCQLNFRYKRLLRERSSLTFSKTAECRFNLKLALDIIITYNTIYTTDLRKGDTWRLKKPPSPMHEQLQKQPSRGVLRNKCSENM